MKQYDNLTTHIKTLQDEMKVLQDEVTDNHLLAADRLIEIQKRYTDLQFALNYVGQMRDVLFPPKIQGPNGQPMRKVIN